MLILVDVARVLNRPHGMERLYKPKEVQPRGDHHGDVEQLMASSPNVELVRHPSFRDLSDVN
jgi:hypothetical protein